jgi:hypothetical protein
MANQIITDKLITVHGRGSLVLPYKLNQKTGDGKTVQVDLSTRTLFFEVDGVPIREVMVVDPADPLGKLVVLENDQIVTLGKTATRCIIRDETDIASGRPVVLWDGKINRDGYIGNPDSVDDA